jgi:subtilisin family serine protease
MRFWRVLLALLSSTILLSTYLPQVSAKENPKGSVKEKATEKATEKAKNKEIPKTTPPKDSTSTQPATDKVEQKASPSEQKPTKSEVVKPTDPTKVEKKLETESVKVVESEPLDTCKIVAKAKKNSVQNLCYDFIVVFKPELARGNSDKLLRDSGARKIREYSKVFNGALVNGPLAKMQALAKNPNVLVVEDDLEIKTVGIQSPAPWGLDRIDQSSLPLTQSFDDRNETGANTYAYVVDTGIDPSNYDFEGRVNGGFTAVLDGRGALDCNGHGTHVAGTIASKNYGVAKKATLIPVRVLDCAGSGTYSSVISGLDWIAANHPVGAPAVVNMSLGGPASSTLDGAIRNLIAKGITVVVAAGNSAADACNYSPARVMEAITVAATSILDVRASYSNFGSCVDVFAPGSEITSTWLGFTATNTISGTSMATPHVAGAIARLISTNPALTPGQITNSLIASATPGVVISPGTSSPNKLLSLYITPDTTTVVPVDSTPTFKKVVPRGKKR